MTEGRFCWYELATDDVEGAQRFYAELLGWSVANSGMPGIDYRVGSVAGSGIVGMMARMEGMPSPRWTGYVAVEDVDGKAAAAERAGATLHMAPTDIPGVGRFAVFADPQGALLAMLQPLPDYPVQPDLLETPGAVGWNELLTTSIDAAWAFHSALFGWEKGEHYDMGPNGNYQLFRPAGDARDFGGFAEPAAEPGWTFYFNVPALDAATDRVKAAGGGVAHVHQVPGGTWIALCTDPQGASFALSAPAR